jgi:hypothetical protein
MTELQASRTLVKSPPELWAECSDAASLARHLDRFGEIRITRLEPETAVAWEGERARGTVRIEPAGWGTKVILTAEAEGAATAVAEGATTVMADGPATVVAEGAAAVVTEEPPPEPTEPEPPIGEVPPAPKRRFARLRAFLRGPEPQDAEDTPAIEAPPPRAEAPPRAIEAPPPAIEAPPAPIAVPTPAPEVPAPAESGTEAALAAALDSLGQAHHRPFSRA